MLIIITAGHRNKSKGDPAEMARTPRFARAYVSALRAANYKVAYAQETLDVPAEEADMFDGTLSDVARWVATTADGVTGPVVMLDLHLEGGVSDRGVFVIVPDDPTKKGQPVDPKHDVWENNKPSRDLGTAIAKEIAAATGLKIRAPKAPGLMSERQSGIGATGKRLAMFSQTARLRDRMRRLIVEHGNIVGDKAIIDHPDTPRKCAEAVVRALSSMPVVGVAAPNTKTPRKPKATAKSRRRKKPK